MAAATLFVAAAFPLGYLISIIANEIAWLPLRFRPESRVRGRIRTDRVLEILGTNGLHSRWLGAAEADMDQRADRQRQSARPNEPARCGDRQAGRQSEEAFVEVLLRMAHRGPAYQDAVTRVRGLADNMNSLLNSCVAVALALTVCTSMYVGICVSGMDVSDDSQRLLTYLAFAAVDLFLLFCIWSAERRVANITEAFVIGMIRGDWPSDD